MKMKWPAANVPYSLQKYCLSPELVFFVQPECSQEPASQSEVDLGVQEQQPS